MNAFRRLLVAGAVIFVAFGLCLCGSSLAKDEKGDKDKGPKVKKDDKGAKPAQGGPHQAGSLPPGLAKKAADHPGRKAYLEAQKKGTKPAPDKKKDTKEPKKDQKAGKGGLPPGLADKSADHPGRKAYEEEMKKGTKPAPDKSKKPKDD